MFFVLCILIIVLLVFGFLFVLHLCILDNFLKSIFYITDLVFQKNFFITFTENFISAIIFVVSL